jgi:hypothetical protein
MHHFPLQIYWQPAFARSPVLFNPELRQPGGATKRMS